MKGKLSDDTVEINTRAPVWMKDLNGNNNLQDITIKIESGEPQYEILEKTEQTIEETCCLSEGVRVRNVYKIETNKYMQVTDRKFVEYKVKDCITTEAFSLTVMEAKGTRNEIKITRMLLRNPLSNTVPIRYVIYGKVNDNNVALEKKRRRQYLRYTVDRSVLNLKR